MDVSQQRQSKLQHPQCSKLQKADVMQPYGVYIGIALCFVASRELGGEHFWSAVPESINQVDLYNLIQAEIEDRRKDTEIVSGQNQIPGWICCKLDDLSRLL
jgi:hypothetical protein